MGRACCWLLLITLSLAGRAPAQMNVPPAQRPAGEARVPNLLGETGLLLTPSAYLQRKQQVSAFAGGTADLVSGGAVAGVADGLELGVTALDAAALARRQRGGARLALNAKLNLVRETLLLPAVSAGVTDALDRLDRGPGWYLVTSKYLIPYFVRALTRQEFAVKLHLGYGSGIYGRELFGGAELFLPGPVSGMAEVRDGRINVGGRLYRGGLRVTLGLFDLRHAGGEISYTASLR